MSPAKFEFGKTEKEKTLLALVAVLIIIFAYFQVFVRPAFVKLFTIVPKVAALRKDIITARSLIAAKDSVERTGGDLREKMAAYEKMFPREQEIPRLLENLSKIANDSGVRILAIKPIPPKRGEQEAPGQTCQAIPIKIEAHSGYHELGRFLEKLEKGDRFIMLDNLEVSADKESIQSHDVTLIALTYVLVKK